LQENIFDIDAQVESNIFSCNSSEENVPIIGELAVEEVNNEEEEKEDDVNSFASSAASSPIIVQLQENIFDIDAQVESNIFSCNPSEDNEEEEEEDDHHERTLFEFLESDFVYESEAKDPVFNSIHTAVQMSLNGLRPDAPSTPPRQRPPIFECNNKCTPKRDKESNAHRTAEDMKDFAINLSPHTFMVLLLYTDNSNAILITH
jgi:hypothetical protein